MSHSCFVFFEREEISFVSCIGDFMRELMEHSNVPSKGAGTAHAPITEILSVAII